MATEPAAWKLPEMLTADSAESVTSSSSTADACSAGAASNTFGLMMRLSNVKAHAVATNKVALEAEQAKDTLEREVQDLEQKMKRQRTDVSTTEANEKMPADVGDLDLAYHCCHATRWRRFPRRF